MMANTFSILLTLATLITGIFWCFFHFVKKKKTQATEDAKQNGQKKKKSGGLFESISSLFPVFIIVFVFRSFIYEPFQIPSGSMMPTLLIGDFILVEKFSYGIKDPIWNKTLIKTGSPKRGDVVVFKYPKNPRIDYIKRVIGLPGDKIVYDVNKKMLTIYPNCGNAQTCKNAPLVISYTNAEYSDYSQLIDLYNYGSRFYTSKELPKINNNEQLKISLLTRKETLDNVTHDIFIQPNSDMNSRSYYHQPNQAIAEWVVPEGSYFAMGDNRDNSEDSRFWGFVPERNLVGRASFIWFSLDKQPQEWPKGIRFSRIGAIH